MRIRAEKLQAELGRQLLPVYLISGDEPLLTTEAADQIRAAAREQGFTERQVFHSDSIQWDQFLAESQAMSLFADKQLLEVRIDNSKPGDKGAKALVEYASQLPSDSLLLVIAGKLDRSQQRSKWVQALENAGGHVQVWPVDARQMQGWLNQRLQQQSIQADQDALKALADRVEGNLLAAQQEIAKLALLMTGKLDLETLEQAVTDSARYDVYTLADRTLAGDSAAALRTLDGLHEEGTEATLLLWTLVRELRQLVAVQEATRQGERLEAAIRQAGVWEKKQPLVHRAVKRLNLTALKKLLLLAREADQQIKGRAPGDVWLTLRELVLGLSGQRLKRSFQF